MRAAFAKAGMPAKNSMIIRPGGGKRQGRRGEAA
jgi:hypothetical protein